MQGKVINGMGKATHFMKVYRKKFVPLLGWTPYLGTLNVELEEPFLLPAKESIAEFTKDGRTYGEVGIIPVTVHGETAAIILPKRTSHKQHVIELIAPVSLRYALGLRTGDYVTILL